jgi:hypothetical protein
MMIVEIQSLIKLKKNYFENIWSWINVGIIICSWTSVGLFIWRYKEMNRISDLFKKTNGFVFINLQLAVYINDLFVYFLAFCCFFGTIKLIHLCRFNYRLRLFVKTVEYARKDLVSFLCMFSLIFMAFLSLFYLLFVSKLWNCQSLLYTAQMLMQMTVMKFSTYELQQAAPFLGPFCFSLFIFLVVFICMSMFISIIIDSFRFVRDNAKVNSNENQHILSFMSNRFQRWIGNDLFICILLWKSMLLFLFRFWKSK